MATIILGIESSCDETGIAIFDSQKGLLANTLYSQIDLHNAYGGVVPELASRDHVIRIIPLIKSCLAQANLSLQEIDAIAYTQGPGLNGALLVGAGVANGLAYSLNKPVIPIHHLEGHILSPMLTDPDIEPPFIALLVSGGHSQLIHVAKIGEYKIVGDTLDDAAGEAFDKTAKMLGLPYPGGKYIAELATQAQMVYPLPRPMLHSDNLDMSFSGLKTATRLLIEDIASKNSGLIPQVEKCNIAKSIEDAITEVLTAKSIKALKKLKINKLIVSGGVSANSTLRNKLNQASKVINAEVCYPPLKYCTDNGAMIALSGAIRYRYKIFNYSFTVKPRWNLNDQTN